MEDKVIELIRFTKISDAEMLANLLKSEGIDCYVRDLFMNQVYGGVDIGGVKVELLEENFQRAQEIMRDYGYLSSDHTNEALSEQLNENENEDFSENENENENDDLSELTEEMQRYQTEKAKRKAKLSKTMTILCFLLLFLYLLMYIYNKYING